MKKYDVIVVGGGTAGCAAAYTAGKLGLKTLLIEKNIHLGGSITSGLVVPAMQAGKNQINTDFFKILISELRAIKGQISYQENEGWLNPELCKIVLDKLMLKSGVDVLFNTTISSVSVVNNEIKHVNIQREMLWAYNSSIEYQQKELFEPIETRYVIDATANCEIGKICECSFLDDKYQPISLRFIMSNVDLKTFSDWLIDIDDDRDVTTVEYIDNEIHLSTAYTWDEGKKWALKPIFDKAVECGDLKNEDRNYFQIFTIAGMPGAIAFNCPRILTESNPLDIYETSKALIEARAAIYRISKFCKKYFPGFEKAYISNIADSLGIRVSKRIKGKYIYTYEDLKSGKKFKTPVLVANYPVDVHSSQKDSSTLEKVGEYSVPIEALMSAEIKNLFVAGRCLSADFLSQGALRIQPSCFSMGEGVAKYIFNQLC